MKNIYASQAYIPSNWSPVSKEITSNGKTFKLYTIEDNLSALSAIVEKASALNDVQQDIFGNAFRGTTHTIGAVEYMSGKTPSVTVNSDPDSTSVSATVGENVSKSFTFTATPVLEGLTWAVSPASQNGVSATLNENTLTLSGKPTQAGNHKFTVSAKYNASDCGTKDITVNAAVKLNSISVSASDKSLNIAAGTEGSITLEAEVTGSYSDGTSSKISNASISWTAVETLPSGFTLENNVLKVASSVDGGDYTITLKVTASYNNLTASKNIAVNVHKVKLKSIAVSASDKSLKLNQGTEGSITLESEVTGSYSDGTSAKILDASISWAAVETLPSGITLSGNVLKVSSSVSQGNYTIQLNVKASYSGITAYKLVNATVNVGAVSVPTTL